MFARSIFSIILFSIIGNKVGGVLCLINTLCKIGM